MSSDHSDRLAELESKLAFLEHTVDGLAEELGTQQSETGMLIKQLEELRRQLENVSKDSGISGEHDERPPHY